MKGLNRKVSTLRHTVECFSIGVNLGCNREWSGRAFSTCTNSEKFFVKDLATTQHLFKKRSPHGYGKSISIGFGAGHLPPPYKNTVTKLSGEVNVMWDFLGLFESLVKEYSGEKY